MGLNFFSARRPRASDGKKINKKEKIDTERKREEEEAVVS